MLDSSEGEDRLEALRRIEEARVRGAEALDLRDLRLVEVPPEIGELGRLEELFLGSSQYPGTNNLLSDLRGLVGLEGLQRLELHWCRAVTDLSPLSGLQQLQQLDLTACGAVADLSPLAGLQQLQQLDLTACDAVADLSPLSGLQQLRQLDLSFCWALADLSPLAGLQQLRQLDLSFCWALADLSPLAGLQQLQQLSLLGCRAVADLSALADLQQLQILRLSHCKQVENLSPIKLLRKLEVLHLDHCVSIDDLSPLQGLDQLSYLSIPEVEVGLDVIRELLEGLPSLRNLIATAIGGVPKEVQSQERVDNCLPRIIAYFAELQHGAESENDVKMFVLGNGKVGKTQLCRRLRGEPYDESIPSTHGVEVWRTNLTVGSDDGALTCTANWWDFGGQDIYHGTHALFLRSRAVFLVLWDPELENRDEDEEDGVPVRNQPLAYWLDYVRSLAGTESPVVVVQSRCDDFGKEVAPPVSNPGFELWRCCAFGAKEDFGRETLEAQVKDAVRFLRSRTGQLVIGSGRAELRRRLFQLQDEDQMRPVEARVNRTMTVERFRGLCNEVEGIASWEHALDYLHQTGVVFHRRDLFAERIVLDQTWALDAIYSVFHRGRSLPLLRGHGRFTRKDLEALVWKDRSEEEQRLLLDMMVQCSVCFRYRTLASGDIEYVAPDLLPAFEEVKDQLFAWQAEPVPATWRLEYRFLHQALIRELMSRIGDGARDNAIYWKYGLWLWDGERRSQLLVRQGDLEREGEPGAGYLEVQAQGEQPLEVLRAVKAIVRKIQIGEKPVETLTVEGKSESVALLEREPEWRRLVKTAREVGELENAVEGGEVSLGRTGGPLPEGAKKSREVYLSYAWGDDSDAGKVRDEVADRLCQALRKDGLAVRRDRDVMRSGDRISSFMKQLGRGDHVVIVVSEKYLRSTYCMFELYRIYQRCQGEAASFLECVAPVVLPEVKLSSLKDRARYIKHWKSEAAELESLAVELGPDIGPDSLQQVRWVREFAMHVDPILVFLQDMLMPRNLEVHFEGDFAEVREVLRRRLGTADEGGTDGAEGALATSLGGSAPRRRSRR